MKVAKGQTLKVDHRRKGVFTGIAERDFDTEQETFYPISLAVEEIEGMGTMWMAWDSVPCRNSLCTLTKLNP